MQHSPKKAVIIGGGISGLRAPVYGLGCGYDVEVLEMHDMAGGLAMSWERGGYTFETCLHWLVGSNPEGDFHSMWREVFAIDRLQFIDPEEFWRVEDEHGRELRVYASIDRLEAEMLRLAPQDAAAIREFAHAVRAMGGFRLLDASGGLRENWRNILHDLPVFPLLGKLGKISGEEYGKRFSDRMLREMFSSGDVGRMTALVMVLTLAWTNAKNAGYCIGGSQAIIQLIEERVSELGGKIRFRA